MMIVVALSGFVVAGYPTAGWVGDRIDRKAELRAAVAGATSPTEAARALDEYFTYIGMNGVADTKYDSMDGLALQAAWQSGADVMPLRQLFPRLLPNVRAESWTISPRHVQRFLGFVEGRINTQVPRWWEWELSHNIVSERGAVLFVGSRPMFDDERPLEFRTFVIGEREVRVSAGTSLKSAGDVVVVRRGELEVAIAQAAFVGEDMTPVYLSVARDSERSYYILFDRIGSAYTLTCIDTETGARRWETEVWASGAEHVVEGGTTGSHAHHATITAKNGGVLVFGGGSGGMYIECFDVVSGHNRFRFSTSCWQQCFVLRSLK